MYFSLRSFVHTYSERTKDICMDEWMKIKGHFVRGRLIVGHLKYDSSSLYQTRKLVELYSNN